MKLNWRAVRLRILLLVIAGTIVNYLARNSLGVLAPQLQRELHISTQQYSYIVGAFQLAYTIAQPLAGLVIDHIGLRAGFAIFAVVWSLANIAHGFARGWLSLAAFRGVLGFAEAAAIPAGMKTIAAWFPDRERSIATGWFNAGTSLGAVLAPPLVVFVAASHGWQGAFAATGAIGLVWAAAWYWLYRDPETHASLTAGERKLIREGQGKLAATGASTLRQIAATRRFWAIAVPRFLAEPAWQTFSFWIPLYLARERGMDLAHIALFAWLPFLAADLGGIFGGYLSPLLARRFRLSLENSRIAGIALGAVLMIAPGCVGLVAGPFAAIALLSIGGFAHQVISVLINTLSADLFPRSDVAKANGLVGMCGWAGGLLFSLAIGQLADGIGFAPLFACLAVFDLVGVVWLFGWRQHLVPQTELTA